MWLIDIQQTIHSRYTLHVYLRGAARGVDSGSRQNQISAHSQRPTTALATFRSLTEKAAPAGGSNGDAKHGYILYNTEERQRDTLPARLTP